MRNREIRAHTYCRCSRRSGGETLQFLPRADLFHDRKSPGRNVHRGNGDRVEWRGGTRRWLDRTVAQRRRRLPDSQSREATADRPPPPAWLPRLLGRAVPSAKESGNTNAAPGHSWGSAQWLSCTRPPLLANPSRSLRGGMPERHAPPPDSDSAQAPELMRPAPYSASPTMNSSQSREVSCKPVQCLPTRARIVGR